MSDDPFHTQLMRLASEVNALRADFDGKLEAIQAEVERRISHSDATAVALSALDKRLAELKTSMDTQLQRVLEAVGAVDDTGAG